MERGILSNLISELKERKARGRKPVDSVAILQLFEEAGEDGLKMEDLVKLFGEDNHRNRRSAASYISNLNIRYLNEVGIHIEGVTVYNIKPADSNLG